MKLPGPIERMEEVELGEQTANVPQGEPEQQPPEDEWKKRFTGYKKSTDETLHQLRMDLGNRDEQLAVMQARFESMSQELNQLRSVAKVPAVPLGVLSDEDVESLGEDNVNRMAKIAKAQLDAERKDIDFKLNAVLTRQQQQDRYEAEKLQKANDERFWDAVRKIVPDADEIDGNKAFSDFLNSTETYSGKRWRDLGYTAKQSGDVTRMAEIYKAFKKGAESPDPRMAELSPLGVGGGPSSTPDGRKIWTRREYQESVAKLYRGGPMTKDKEEKIERIHAAYLQALREKRVRD